MATSSKSEDAVGLLPLEVGAGLGISLDGWPGVVSFFFSSSLPNEEEKSESPPVESKLELAAGFLGRLSKLENREVASLDWSSHLTDLGLSAETGGEVGGLGASEAGTGAGAERMEVAWAMRPRTRS